MPPLFTARNVFESTFGSRPMLSVQAPGRVNLIGEHTDYNDGFVLPCAIDYHTAICGSPRDDRRICVVAVDYGGERDEIDLGKTIEPRADMQWANYVRGVVKYMQDAGHAIGGADLAISGNVPQGAGLSSSASLEVATARFLAEMGGRAVDPTELALIGQRAENLFVGCNCGIMDQLISASGVAGHALLIDCRTLATHSVAMPEGIAVLIINSNVQRGLVGSEYNARRRQCEDAARFFGVKALRDVDLATYTATAARLDPVVARRARHVITDSQRALDLAAALPSGNMRRIGQLMADSHASMRNDFEITCPQVDTLVDIVKDVIGEAGGVRMTGGGFGGCVVALMPNALIEPVRAAVTEHYPAATGMQATIYVCQPSSGAHVVTPAIPGAVPSQRITTR